jgi:hypothetical protein
MNSSKTWKSGERCVKAGLYRCQQCHLEGRETTRVVQAGAIFPMCEMCPGGDATWRLIRPEAPASRESSARGPR